MECAFCEKVAIFFMPKKEQIKHKILPAFNVRLITNCFLTIFWLFGEVAFLAF